MRPDVARAFDRMERAARARRDRAADHERRSAPTPSRRSSSPRHPDPRWVAPPGRSLHRLGTELDLGPPSAYGWLAANAERFHFTQRYSWEPWHFGYTLNAHSSPAAQVTHADGDGAQQPAGLRAAAVRAGARARGAALERLRDPAGRAAVRGEQLQPVRCQPRRRAGDRAVHARHGGRDGPARPVRRRARDRRAGAPDARPAAALPGASRSRSPPTTPARERSRRAAACPPTARRRATSRGSSASWAAPGSALLPRSRSDSFANDRRGAAQSAAPRDRGVWVWTTRGSRACGAARSAFRRTAPGTRRRGSAPRPAPGFRRRRQPGRAGRP